MSSLSVRDDDSWGIDMFTKSGHGAPHCVSAVQAFLSLVSYKAWCHDVPWRTCLVIPV